VTRVSEAVAKTQPCLSGNLATKRGFLLRYVLNRASVNPTVDAPGSAAEGGKAWDALATLSADNPEKRAFLIEFVLNRAAAQTGPLYADAVIDAAAETWAVIGSVTDPAPSKES
jgi:hypothetical protein